MRSHAEHLASPTQIRAVLARLPLLMAKDLESATFEDFQRYIELAQNAPWN